ncbi:MAG TPA: hypothetical protein GXZ64_07325 [Clostridiaceae bacterium]|nr:hypothetical protein [Clostridiaceae bacterium]
MRYLGPLAVFAVSVAVAYEPSIGVMPVLAFLFGLLSAILPPALPERYGRTIGYSTIFLVPVFFRVHCRICRRRCTGWSMKAKSACFFSWLCQVSSPAWAVTCTRLH